MGCTNILVNALCFECKEKEWNDQDKKYFCKRFNMALTRVDGNSGGAVKTIQCINSRGRRPKKESTTPP